MSPSPLKFILICFSSLSRASFFKKLLCMISQLSELAIFLRTILLPNRVFTGEGNSFIGEKWQTFSTSEKKKKESQKSPYHFYREWQTLNWQCSFCTSYKLCQWSSLLQELPFLVRICFRQSWLIFPSDCSIFRQGAVRDHDDQNEDRLEFHWLISNTTDASFREENRY